MNCCGNELELIVADITGLDTDCIVNAANRSLLGGGGVDGAIHRAAGRGLLEECRTLGGCETGEAKITSGHRLPARYVIHTVGPVYSGTDRDAVLLARCYANSLDLAYERGLKSIAFPCISTGVYCYPPAEAAKVALNAVEGWCASHRDAGMRIIFCTFDARSERHYLDTGRFS